MDKYQKQVQMELLGHEEETREKLKANYKEALAEIKQKLSDIMESPDFQRERISRAKWDQMLEGQLETILRRLGEKNVSDMTEYLDTMYREAFLGCLFGIHQDGIGFVLQINEDKVERSLNRETAELKFSKRLYENTDRLKEDVKAEMARGFSTGRDYISIARQITLRSGISLGRSCTIARTEGHRVTEESRFDCMKASAGKGAGIAKQWDSTLDDVTRGTHRELDGQVRELDEAFEIPSTGAKAMYPGGFGIAKEDINCRCAMLSRAKWMLGDDEYKYSRAVGDIINLKSQLYSDWKNKYNKSADILFRNAPGKNDADTIDDKIRLLELLNNMSAGVTEALLDVEYRFGSDRSMCDIENGVVYLKQGTTEKVMLHEIGHLLEGRIFDRKELHELKTRYTEGLSGKDVISKVYQTESGQDVGIVIVRSPHFIEEYQGRLYISETEKALNNDGTVNVDIMDEFVSVLIPEYFLNPERLNRQSPELYEFIRRYME